MLVHDNDFQPRQSAHLPTRWRALKKTPTGKRRAAAFSYIQGSLPSAALDWLEYQHWPCTADPSLRGIVSPVRDNDSYNQGPGPRELNAVPDVLLSCRVRCTEDGELRFVARDGEQQFGVVFEPADVSARNDGKRDALSLSINTLSAAGSQIEFGLCDQQLLLAIDGRTVISRAYERPSGPSAETLHTLAIGAARFECRNHAAPRLA